MKAIHIIENLDNRYGGPAQSVPSTCKYLGEQGVETKLLSIKVYKNEENSLVSQHNLSWDSFDIRFFKKLKYSPMLKSAILQNVSDSNTILHIQNLWNYPAYCTCSLHKKYGFPLVCSIRGALYEWSLSQSRFPKAMAWRLFQKDMLQSADCVHATEVNELKAVRKLGIRTPVAIIPNAVDTAQFENRTPKYQAAQSLGIDPEKKHILFMSRLHSKKGLEFLILAWSKLANKFLDWELIIAGPNDDKKYYKRIQQLITQNSLSPRVIYLGMLKEQKKLNAFFASDLFVLPSQTENFGIVIAEAMAAKIPVITTRGTPWKEIEEKNAGWWIKLSEDNLKSALSQALETPSTELSAKGANGFDLVKSRYNWFNQAGRLKQVYSWILKKGPKPDCVHLW